MQPTEQIHRLLPWYVAGTLETDEASAFRDHLPHCKPCREEMAFLERVAAGLEEHGESLLEDHPTAERVVAAAHGELEAQGAEAVFRHLALCPACAAEARWVRGEGVAVPAVVEQVAGPPATRAAWGWVVAAAAMVALAVVLPLKGRQENLTGVVRPLFVESTERSAGESNAFELGPNDPAARLYFAVDLPASSFPIEIRLLDDASRTIYSRAGIQLDDLVGELYLFLDCDRRDCPAGDYVARIETHGDAQPAQSLDFRIVEP